MGQGAGNRNIPFSKNLARGCALPATRSLREEGTSCFIALHCINRKFYLMVNIDVAGIEAWGPTSILAHIFSCSLKHNAEPFSLYVYVCTYSNHLHSTNAETYVLISSVHNLCTLYTCSNFVAVPGKVTKYHIKGIK